MFMDSLSPRIHPIRRVYVQQQSESLRHTHFKGNRVLTARSSYLNENHLYSKNVRSLSLKTQVLAFTVQKLKPLSNVQFVSIDLSLQDAQELKNILRLLKAFKRLRIITFDSTIATTSDIPWLERFFKLFRRQLISFRELNLPKQAMQKPELPKFIRLISKLKEIWLQSLLLEIEEDNNASLSNFSSLSKILATYHSKPLILKLYCYAHNINTFVPALLNYLLDVKNLKVLTFIHCYRKPNDYARQVAENYYPTDIDFLPLFAPLKKLRILLFSALYNASIVKFFPLDELQELEFFSIQPGRSDYLGDNDFEIWVTRLKSCQKLRRLNFNLRDCTLLSDISTKNLCNQLLKSLPNLEILNLTLGCPPHAGHMLSFGFAPSKSNYTPLTIKYLAESLSTMKKLRHLNLGIQIETLSDGALANLFDTLSQIKTLQVLEMSIFSEHITDLVSSPLRNCLENLLCLENFTFALRSSRQITNSFLADVSSAFTTSKYLRTIRMNFQNSLISREAANDCSNFINSQLPSCNISIYSS